MEVKPGYKLTEVGVIPEDWDAAPLGALFDFQNGVNAPKRAYGRGIPFINVLDVIASSHVRFHAIRGRVDIGHSLIQAFLARRGDVFFNRTSETQCEVGLASTYTDDDLAVFGGFVIRGRPTTKALDAVYSGYALRSPEVRTQIVSRGQGAVHANIAQKDLRSVWVAVPPSQEQVLIGRALRDADALIGSLEQLLAKKRAIMRGAMQELMTGKRRLPGFNEAWTETTLGAVTRRFIGGGTPSRAVHNYWGGRIPWMTVKDFANNDCSGTIEHITEQGLNNSASRLIIRGTLIVSTRMALGKAALLDVDVAINQDLKAVVPNDDMNTRFLYYWFQWAEPHIVEMGSGSTVKGLALTELGKIPFLKPPLVEQEAIASAFLDMNSELGEVDKKLDKARCVKRGMMQELLTGRIRLA